jgi:glyoxylase-like metal-dependent hydrolase (beta-lactamase superfamily II)/rhodanese-related sulfurtransferase
MPFRQLFDTATSTYTYLLGDPNAHEAVIIDPVLEHVEEYLALLKGLGLKLRYSLETHVHADHITASGTLRERTSAETGVNTLCGASLASVQLNDSQVLPFGQDEQILVIATPGHTPGSTSFLWRDRLFTGDALLINGCGRTDFQGGDPGALYDAITTRLFTLPAETLVYPGHDYNGRQVSCIGQERATNARLAGKPREGFIAIMAALHLPRPQRMDEAVPANRLCGLSEEEADKILARQAADPAHSNRIDQSASALALGATAGKRTAQDLVAAARAAINEIPPTVAQGLLDGGLVLLDVREPEEFAAGHLPGAVSLPRGTLEFRVGALPGAADPDVALLVYCKSGGRAALAATTLCTLGYRNVRSIAGGFDACVVAGLPVEH